VSELVRFHELELEKDVRELSSPEIDDGEDGRIGAAR
jgi:hypothetical protein